MAYYWGIDPIIWLIILVGGFGAVLAAFGLGSKWEYEKGLTFKDSLGQAWKSGLLGLIIGLVLAFLLSLYPVFTFGFAGLYGSFLFFVVFAGLGFGAFFVGGFAYYFINIPIRLKQMIIFGIIGVAIGFTLWMVFIATTGPVGEYANFAFAPIREKIDDVFDELEKFKYCFYADARCPFFIQWDEAERINPLELLNIDVEFSDQRILRDEVNVLVSVTVKNPELTELEITPKCYLGEKKKETLKVKHMGKYASGDKFIFPLSGEDMHTSFRCFGDISHLEGQHNTYFDKVLVEFERPVRLTGNWPVYIGSEPNMGRTKTILAYNAPYSIALYSFNDMPFEEGHTYDASLAIKRIDEDTELKFIKEIRIEFPDSILAGCGEAFDAVGQTLNMFNVDAGVLKNSSRYYSNDEEEIYTFPCSIYVRSAPVQATLAPINIEAYYDVVSKYDAPILKPHSEGYPGEEISLPQPGETTPDFLTPGQ
ncbi:MAG: hypothetical protein JSW08_00985 [archaeon]|nr:MAG: hypothetical protein JSW08_00985 [archaeon]